MSAWPSNNTPPGPERSGGPVTGVSASPTQPRENLAMSDENNDEITDRIPAQADFIESTRRFQRLMAELADTHRVDERAEILRLLSAEAHGQAEAQLPAFGYQQDTDGTDMAAALYDTALVLTALASIELTRATGLPRLGADDRIEEAAGPVLDRLVTATGPDERRRLMVEDLAKALGPAVGARAVQIITTVAETIPGVFRLNDTTFEALLNAVHGHGKGQPLDGRDSTEPGTGGMTGGQLDTAEEAYRELLDSLHGVSDPQARANALRGMRARLMEQASLRRRVDGSSKPPYTARELDDMATVVGALMFTEVSRATHAARLPAETPVIEDAAGEVLDRLAAATGPDELFRLMAVHLYDAVAPIIGANAAVVITEIAATVTGVTPALLRSPRTAAGTPTTTFVADKTSDVTGGERSTSRQTPEAPTGRPDQDEIEDDVLVGKVGPPISARPELWEPIPGTPPLAAPGIPGAATTFDGPAGEPGWTTSGATTAGEDGDGAVRITVHDLSDEAAPHADTPRRPADPTTQPDWDKGISEPGEEISAEEQRRAMVAGAALMVGFCVLVFTWLPSLGFLRMVLTIGALLTICGGVAAFAGLLAKWAREES